MRHLWTLKETDLHCWITGHNEISSIRAERIAGWRCETGFHIRTESEYQGPNRNGWPTARYEPYIYHKQYLFKGSSFTTNVILCIIECMFDFQTLLFHFIFFMPSERKDSEDDSIWAVTWKYFKELKAWGWCHTSCKSISLFFHPYSGPLDWCCPNELGQILVQVEFWTPCP